MPTTLERTIATRLGAPVAVLTVVGSYDTIWYGYNHAHLLGPPGPRGGRRTACGLQVRNTWHTREMEHPSIRYRDGRVWQNLCRDCRAGLVANLAPVA